MTANYIYFPAFYKRESGIWYFSPKEGTFEKGVPSFGMGAIRYGEGSIYEGDIYYDGKNFHKLGFGIQDFTYSSIGAFNEIQKRRIFLFVGNFDYRVSNWIYGNGVLYLTDANNNPVAFVKGFFYCLEKVGEYDGEFDYSALIKGYTKDMEIEEYNPKNDFFKMTINRQNNRENIQNIFIGDSYFEYWNYETYAGKGFTFDEIFDETCLNIGVGGSKFRDWIPFLPLIRKNMPIKNIFINLGFNDINIGYKYENIKNEYLEFLKLLREYYPTANYYLFMTTMKAGEAHHYLDRHKEWNNYIDESSKENNITILHLNDLIEASSENCIYLDDVHINHNGYVLMKKLIDEVLKNG